MGIFTRKIAQINKEPEQVTISENPNFIVFESLPKTESKVNIKISIAYNEDISISDTRIIIREIKTGLVHSFIGTLDQNSVNSTTFFINDVQTITAENVKSCLLNSDFFKGKFDITIPFENIEGKLNNGGVISIVSKGSGIDYSFSIETNKAFAKVIGDPTSTTNTDSLLLDGVSSSIELDIYTNNGLKLGNTDLSNPNLGTYLNTLSKAYQLNPISFDINSITRDFKQAKPTFLNSAEWVDADTMTDIRFIAYRNDGVNKEPFYISNVFYTLLGSSNLNLSNLDNYIYDCDRFKPFIKPLTNVLECTHVKGQTQYFNFILKSSSDYNNTISLLYTLKSQSGRFIANVYKHQIKASKLNNVNTIKLDIDNVINQFSNVGIVEVFLCDNSTIVSEPMIFKMLSDCYYSVHDFAFLNNLGGWSSINFGGSKANEFKSKSNTIVKNVAYNHTVSDDITSVISKDITEKYTIQTMPISPNVANKLKEIAESKQVYEIKSKKYIIVDEVSLKTSSSDELVTLEMKYYYSKF